MRRLIRTVTIFALAATTLSVAVTGFAQTSESPAASESTTDKPERWDEWRPAVLQVVTNFDKADVTVNGLPYLAYEKKSDTDGMVLPAGGPHEVKVEYKESTKIYKITLEPEKKRVLMVDLSGFEGNTPTSSRDNRSSGDQQKEEEGNVGRVTVYSKPRGTIIVDGEQKDEGTPGTVEIDPGRHRISVKFRDGSRASTKTVRVRKGSRIKLFFRQK
jgi:hypothetical protein